MMISRCLILSVMAHMLAMGNGAAESVDGGEIAEIRQLPITSMHRVTREDGNVFWVSGDRRFAFVGEVIDMWTGQPEQELENYAQMSWGRSGRTPAELAWAVIGKPTGDQPSGLLFITQACQRCQELLNAAKQAKEPLGLVPISHTDEWTGWLDIWCAQERDIGALERWLENKSGSAQTCISEPAGVAMAFAHVFALQPPVSGIDGTGRIFQGKQEVQEWLFELQSP